VAGTTAGAIAGRFARYHFLLASPDRRGRRSDLLHAFSELLAETGAEIVAAVASSRAPVLTRTPLPQVRIGDLEIWRIWPARMERNWSSAILTPQKPPNVSVSIAARRHSQYDRIGGYQCTWIGYGGSRQLLFDLANALLEPANHAVTPYHSLYSRKADSRQETSHGTVQTFANSDRWH